MSGSFNKEIKNLPLIINVPRTDPIYNTHAYLTKVPYGAIKPFIEAFSRPGDTIADIFAGSGMTGIAAIMLGRNAIVSDISVLGQHIGTGLSTFINENEFQKVADEVIKKAKENVGLIYKTKRFSDKKELELIRTIWSFIYECPDCKSGLVYFEEIDENGESPKSCTHCNSPFVKRSWKRVGEKPVRVVVTGSNGKQVEQKISALDLKRIKQAAKDKRQKNIPSYEIDSYREMFTRSALKKAGLHETKSFFSPRNAIALYELWKQINNIRDKVIKKKLLFSFTAILARASKRYQWSHKRPLNAQNQTYYISAVFYEWNVFELFERKVSASIRSVKTIYEENPIAKKYKFEYKLSSADQCNHLDNESVNYIFTDPPFGSNIFYADMNLFHEAWLGKKTNDKVEAVVHTSNKKKKKAEEKYFKILKNSFKQAARALKSGGYMSVVFGNSNGSTWAIVQNALRESGFLSNPVHVAILDKGQRSVKGLSSGKERVATIDLVITVQKPMSNIELKNTKPLIKADLEYLIKSAIKNIKSQEKINPSYLYASILMEAFRNNMKVDNIHLADVVIALRNAGHKIDVKTGLLDITGKQLRKIGITPEKEITYNLH